VATHKLGFPSKDKELAVTIPGPEVLDFVSGDKDADGKALGLPMNGTLLKNDKDLEISVEVNNDDALATTYQSMTYLWKKNTQNDSEEGMVEVETNIYDNDDDGNVGKKTDTLALANATPGWYKVYVTSMLNRDTISIESNVARVTKAPVAPTLKFAYDPAADNVDLVDANAFPNRLVELKIESNAYPNPVKLHTDKLIYEWYDEDVLITKDTPGFTLVDNKLLIDGKLFSNQKMLIECHVSNELNGAVSGESRSGIFMVSF
jgi:hypothetical protein